MKRSRNAGASRRTPCNSVLNQTASASWNSSSSRICASISPASCKPVSPRSSQEYTPCSANSRARRRALRLLPRPDAPEGAADVLLVVKLSVLVVILVFVVVIFVVFVLGFERCPQFGPFHSATRTFTTLSGTAFLSFF